MSEALKKAREALQPFCLAVDEGDDLARGTHYVDNGGRIRCKGSFLAAIKNARAALAAIDAEAKPVVRMLTDGEIADALSGYGMMTKQIQRKFAEVNGLTIGEQG